MKKLHFIFFALFLYTCGLDPSKNSLTRLKIRGVIVNKYIDNFNHAAPVLVYVESNKEEEFYVGRWDDNTGLWEDTQIGDSLIKESNTLDLCVKKKNGSYIIYKSKY